MKTKKEYKNRIWYLMNKNKYTIIYFIFVIFAFVGIFVFPEELVEKYGIIVIFLISVTLGVKSVNE